MAIEYDKPKRGVLQKQKLSSVFMPFLESDIMNGSIDDISPLQSHPNFFPLEMLGVQILEPPYWK